MTGASQRRSRISHLLRGRGLSCRIGAALLIAAVIYLVGSGTLPVDPLSDSTSTAAPARSTGDDPSATEDAEGVLSLGLNATEKTRAAYNWTRSLPFIGFDVDLEMTRSLEFLRQVPPVEDFWRVSRIRPSHNRAKADGSEPVRIACLYAGFVRDFESMWMRCGERKASRKYCVLPHGRKFFGQQRDNIVGATDCDVFLSTWDIRGEGRFDTTKYANHTVPPQAIKNLYGPRLARLHMQNYSAYEPLWRMMHVFKRSFPQTRPTVQHLDAEGRMSWEGVPETNPFVRINDYSQSYKQWCVLQLVNRYSNHYDLYFRLRTDLRSTHRFENIRFAHNFTIPIYTAEPTVAPGASAAALVSEWSVGPLKSANRTILFELRKVEDKESLGGGAKPAANPGPKAAGGGAKGSKDRDASEDGSGNETIPQPDGGESDSDYRPPPSDVTSHSIHASRLHVNNFDVGDFGFLGPPLMITELAKLWAYCIAPAELRVPAIRHVDISEYNLMLWHIVFTRHWEVDSGGRYLWVSRRAGKDIKKMSAKGSLLKQLRARPGFGGLKIRNIKRGR